MRKIFCLIIHAFMIISMPIVVGCSNENQTMDALESNQIAPINLVSPNGVKLANDISQLKLSLSDNAEKVEILQVSYLDLQKEKNSLVANVTYLADGIQYRTMIVRNVNKLNFEEGTILKFEKSDKNNQTNRGGDIYVSCSGSSCCYPSGTYDPGSGTITTSCKCDGSGGSCVMRISDTPPDK